MSQSISQSVSQSVSQSASQSASQPVSQVMEYGVWVGTAHTSPRPRMPPLHTDSPASLTLAIVRNLSSYDLVVITCSQYSNHSVK